MCTEIVFEFERYMRYKVAFGLEYQAKLRIAWPLGCVTQALQRRFERYVGAGGARPPPSSTLAELMRGGGIKCVTGWSSSYKCVITEGPRMEPTRGGAATSPIGGKDRT